MISEQDKQSFLNGAYGILSNGLKVKFIDEEHSSLVCVIKTSNAWAIRHLEKDSLTIIGNPNKASLVGLWKGEPEPFDLERALNGEPVLLRCGLKAYIKFKLDNVSDERDALCGYIVQRDGTMGVMSWKENGGANYGKDENNDDIIGMWREPKPQLSNNSLQLPKPLTSPPTEKTYYFIGAGVTFADGAYVVVETTWDNDHGDKYRLNCGRIYASRDDAIKVIETITGKPYKDR